MKSDGITIVKDKPEEIKPGQRKMELRFTCRFQESGICKNKKSELYESKVFASIVCIHFSARKAV